MSDESQANILSAKILKDGIERRKQKAESLLDAPHCSECGGSHEPSGARIDCIRYWKLRALMAEDKLLVRQIWPELSAGRSGLVNPESRPPAKVSGQPS